MHFQISPSCSDCCLLYKIDQQVVVVFPVVRILRWTSIVWEKEDLVRNLGVLSFWGYPLLGWGSEKVQRERPRETYPFCSGASVWTRDVHLPRGCGMGGPERKLGGCLAMAAPPLPLGKCGFLECRLQRCPGTDSSVIVKECVRHWVAPDICFLPNRIVFKSKSPLTRTMGGLYLLQSGSFSEPFLSHPFPLAYMLQFWLVVARG